MVSLPSVMGSDQIPRRRRDPPGVGHFPARKSVEMFPFTYRLASVLILLSQPSAAQIVQNNWISPAGTDPDFQQTFTNGNAISVAWEGWNSSIRTQYFEEKSTTADLWVTSYNFGLSPFSQLLSGKCRISCLYSTPGLM
jgi:hypothetical protein